MEIAQNKSGDPGPQFFDNPVVGREHFSQCYISEYSCFFCSDFVEDGIIHGIDYQNQRKDRRR